MKNYPSGWLRLIRLPNLLTVPGDLLAGLAVMTLQIPQHGGQVPDTTQIIVACLASLLLYMAGLLDNDLVDQAYDAKERPDRPIPSGCVPQEHVLAGMAVCGVGAILIGYQMLPPMTFDVEVILLVTILVYNRLKLWIPFLGGLLMGLCRGLNVLLGASLLASTRHHPSFDEVTITLAVCWMVYIFSVTLVSQRETTGHVAGRLGGLPAFTIAVLSMGYGVLLLTISDTAKFFIPFTDAGRSRVLILGLMIFGLLALAFSLACWSAVRIRRHRTPEVVQESVGILIRNLLLLQAAACLVWDIRLAFALLALWPLHYLLGRRFYAS